MIIDEYDVLKGEPFQIINEQGKVMNLRFEPKMSKPELVMMYKMMILARLADDKAIKLQRAGRMGTFAPAKGQEAAQIGSALASKKEDWIVPAFRESAVAIAKGIDPSAWYVYNMGNEMGNKSPDGVNMLPISICVGQHLVHAVGIGWAAKLKKEQIAVLTYFGDGATSEGAFHEAMNFAGVFKTPTVFICQNNQYAISLRVEKQTASKTIAQKAIAYGFDGIRVDGNDILAMYAVTREAVEKARKGGGPTLIEAYTYRLGVHTTADDPTLYRTEEEVREWQKRDPILRLKLYLKEKGIWTKELDREAITQANDVIAKAVEKAENYPDPKTEDIFKYMYSEMTNQLKEQLEYAEQFREKEVSKEEVKKKAKTV